MQSGTKPAMKHAVIVGFGYSGAAIGRALMDDGWRVTGTGRSAKSTAAIRSAGAEAVVFDGTMPSGSLRASLVEATHVVMCAAPDADGDPLLPWHGDDLAAAPKLEWLGYLSTVGVYGDHGGGWVDEATPPAPGSQRSRQRLAAERAWSALAEACGRPLQIFRLSGIYGPGRCAFDRLAAGTARRIVKPGQVFNRIHIDDIAGAVLAGIAHPEATGAFNVTDDLPAPPQDVIVHAAELAGLPLPPEVTFAAADMTPMARSFYSENKRVRNSRVKSALGYAFRHPTYREGLAAILATRQA